MPQTQLLCTFCTVDALEQTLDTIIRTYDIALGVIYVLNNIDDDTSLCCTYNIDLTSPSAKTILPSTISLHRKKATNTLYTINALNLLIESLNGGQLDKSFPIPWQSYRNTILVTAYNQLKILHTSLNKIVKISDRK